jgi:pyridoxine kinase
MGDTGRGIYVKPGIPGIFKNELCPLADIVTPNQFELETLTGIAPDNTDNARRAIDALHKIGPPVVLVTSFLDGKKPAEGRIGMLVSDRSGLFRIPTPQLPLDANAAGCGDLTASVFLSFFLQTGDSKTALERCAGSVYGILEKSFLKHTEQRETGPLELLLVEAQEELVNPSRVFEAVKI